MEDDLRTELARAFTGRCEDTARELEALAAKIRSLGADIIEVPHFGTIRSAGSIACTITHSLMWGLANAGADRIVQAAIKFDEKIVYASPVVSAVPEVEASSIDAELVREALVDLNDAQAQALLELASVAPRYTEGRVPTAQFAAPPTAAALQHRKLADWAYSPRRGYKITPLGEAVVESIKAGLRAKLADDQDPEVSQS